ncbi:aldehyde dehydrogenase [Salipiger sp. P9]|uniref:aldehyde dehydrogenase n=1 Tax=Salipiger pentaromativorans TaxID=2943193 RepID=UPI0021573487|nr:aldehyde dehydrogenase [Salipiger pentaromativorans]MCR8551202.1 aldehyde dehydrogenase [Salipiger pentaromativorans]
MSDTFFTHPDKLFIGGAWVAPSSPARFDVLDSATEEVFASYAAAQTEDMARAVTAARTAFDEGPWPRMTHAERARYLRAVADELDKRADLQARAWTTEAGVLLSLATSRMGGLSNTYRYYADLAETYPFRERHTPEAGGEVAYVVREPVGVVAAIVAWNGAPGLVTTKVAPALLAGCTVVLKAAPEAPGAAYVLAEACEAAGLPPGVLNVVTADREVSEQLVRNPGIDKVTFTGSTAAGRRIAAICGERIARCTLELGGKSPAIVLEDYDVEKAAQAIASKAIFMTGQVCFSLTRVIVPRPAHDAMVEALSARLSAVTVGSPYDPETQMGPLASAAQRDRVEGYIAKGLAEGAVLATGGRRPPHLERGYFVEPTVFGNVAPGATIAQEEIFGPVLSVIPVDNTEDAIRVANDTIFGLNASVYTKDAERAFAVASRVRSGTVGHNDLRRERLLPFGGFKQSGLGREGGPEGLAAYLETKVIILDGAYEPA